MLEQYKVISYAVTVALMAVLVLPVDGKAFISEPDVGAGSKIKIPKDKGIERVLPKDKSSVLKDKNLPLRKPLANTNQKNNMRSWETESSSELIYSGNEARTYRTDDVPEKLGNKVPSVK